MEKELDELRNELICEIARLTPEQVQQIIQLYKEKERQNGNN